MAQHIKLGKRVKDTITGFEGIVVGRTEWLYGCVRVSVQPQTLHEGKPVEYQIFDEPQLVEINDEVSGTPDSGRHGNRPDVGRRPDVTR